MISQIRYGAPIAAVSTPTGSSVGANSLRAKRSASTTITAPSSAEQSSGICAVRVIRRAICGASSATKSTGPAVPVATEASTTPSRTSPSRMCPRRTPSAVAVPSSIDTVRWAYAAHATAGSRISSTQPSGVASSQPRR